MSDVIRYMVHAAEYKDMTFQSVVSRTEEFMGPFDNYHDAYKAWQSISYRWVDHCTHKAQILRIK